MAKKLMRRLIDMLGEKHGEAKAANEQRYEDLLGTLRSSQARTSELYGQAAGELTLPASYGSTARTRAARAAAEGSAADTQHLVSSGLYNSTIASALSRQRARDLEEANQAIDEQVATTRSEYGARRSNLFAGQAAAEAGGASEIAGAIAGRTDEYPDLSLWLNLLTQIGQAKGQGEGTGINNKQLLNLLSMLG